MVNCCLFAAQSVIPLFRDNKVFKIADDHCKIGLGMTELFSPNDEDDNGDGEGDDSDDCR